MKRIVCLLVGIAVLSCVVCSAVEIPVVSLVQDATSITEKIDVNVLISENSNAYGGKIDIFYDNTLLRPEGYEISEILEGGMCLVNLNYGDSLIRISWAGTDALTEGGKIMKLTFVPLVKQSFETQIVIDEIKIADADGNKLSVTTNNGKIVCEPNSRPSGRGHSGGGQKNTSEAVDSGEQKSGKSCVFKDVKETDWFYDYVQIVYESGLMRGVDENVFEPNEKLTRAMFISVVHRMCDMPKIEEQTAFTDINVNAWYAPAVAWGYKNGIISGVSKTEFAPDAYISREQVAAILCRYAKYKGVDVEKIAEDADMSGYLDAKDISDWALEAVRYCVAKKIIRGNEDGYILPQSYSTRAEMAALVSRFIET